MLITELKDYSSANDNSTSRFVLPYLAPYSEYGVAAGQSLH